MKFLCLNIKVLRQRLLAILLILFTAISGFTALGLYLFTSDESDFDGTYAEVIHEGLKFAKSGVSYRWILYIKFETKKGENIEASISTFNSSALKKGDLVPILYDPRNPHIVKMFTNSNTFFTNKTMTVISFLIFLFGLYGICYFEKTHNKKV
jgi:hypothetical protein